MKKVFLILAFMLGATSMNAQEKKAAAKEPVIVEVACGQCMFGMKEIKKGCDLAAMVDGKPYFVEGTKLDDHGDAHAADGFCSAVRKAEVVGELKNNVFVVTEFKLLPRK
ncbi:hypothetical protein HKT18_06500 [Flavobacterium sp. IMCC34852]|uniref:Glutaminyl-tRNA synthetase n=1 Tax=Flavobacterium rivulicola TaxID=2732161 RepID=A0A7Y3R8M0_9FLAO|nr:DUF6370 family protein [Flavobacterium sp. IMCC34852]NNT71861.1 hypothetical protein [Flavobacterium sp. IMCC34852]